jgi:hypothetical protein
LLHPLKDWNLRESRDDSSDARIIAVDGKDVATRGASFFSRREESGIERAEARAWAVEAHATVGFRVARSLEVAR